MDGGGERRKGAPLLVRLRCILAPAKVLSIEPSGHLSYTLRAIPYAHSVWTGAKRRGRGWEIVSIATGPDKEVFQYRALRVQGASAERHIFGRSL
jgi:hypothetical protein